MRWRVLVTGKNDPFYNMALDEAIYLQVTQDASLPTIRFYDWQPASFSCGFNQKIEEELSFELLNKSPYGFVRRPTGGRMVLHEDEVTYSVVSPLKERMSGNVSHTYLRIGEALLTGLKVLNIEAELSRGVLSRQEQVQSANPCFTSSSRFEITYKKKKIVGSAQTRNQKAFLQHGSILMSHNQRKVADFMPFKSEDDRLRIASLLERRTISLRSILNRKLTFTEVTEKMIEGFKKSWYDDEFVVGDSPTPEETEKCTELIRKKYSTKEWNKKK